MALRQIRMLGDEILTKPCREVTEITPRIQELIEDLLDTMYEANGVGLSAPQVGVLRRVVVIDVWQDDMEPEETEESADIPEGPDAREVSDEREEPAAQEVPDEQREPDAENLSEDEEWEDSELGEGPLIMINPVITRTEGEQTGDEGCLSLPGKVGQVTRPYLVEVSFFDENMDEYTLEAEGLLARAICHEVDHLDGHMYVELVEGEIHDAGYQEFEEEEDEPGEDPGESPAEEN